MIRHVTREVGEGGGGSIVHGAYKLGDRLANVQTVGEGQGHGGSPM